MTQTDIFLDAILGGFFWAALLIPLLIFGVSMAAGVFKKIWPQHASGGFLYPDQIITNKIFALGENAGARRIDGEKRLHVTSGLRGASLAVLGFGVYWYYDLINKGGFEVSYMDFLLVGSIVYYVVFSWMFSVRYEHERMWVRDWTLRA